MAESLVFFQPVNDFWLQHFFYLAMYTQSHRNFSEITCQRVHFSDYKLALPMKLNWRFWLVIFWLVILRFWFCCLREQLHGFQTDIFIATAAEDPIGFSISLWKVRYTFPYKPSTILNAIMKVFIKYAVLDNYFTPTTSNLDFILKILEKYSMIKFWFS